jgi:hypothetical protein
MERDKETIANKKRKERRKKEEHRTEYVRVVTLGVLEALLEGSAALSEDLLVAVLQTINGIDGVRQPGRAR